MKKLIAAIVIASVGAALAEQSYIVYDYKASIKRLEISAKYNKKIGVTQKYSVKSDTIQGYVTIPVCENCTKKDEDVDTALDILNLEDYPLAPEAYAYLTLKSNSKLLPRDEAYVKAPIKVAVGVFGADQIAESGEIADEKKINKAWMALDYPMPLETLAEGELVAKKDLVADVDLGFLGLGNQGTQELRFDEQNSINVQNTGFGTAKTLPGSSSFCGGKGSACLTVQTISGTLVGYPLHFGACGHGPMWDLCQNFDEDLDIDVRVYEYEETRRAVISGTWTLKYNKTLTDQFASQREAAILNKIGGYILIDEDGE